MHNPTFLIPNIVNQDLTRFYANYLILNQKLVQNSIYQNSINFNSLISYAVSMDFKKFETQYYQLQSKTKAANVQASINQLSQNKNSEVNEKKEKKNQKNLKITNHKIVNQLRNQVTDTQEKSQKQDLKSKTLTLDDSFEKIQFDDYSIKENKNSDKKFKKSNRLEKVRELPNIDLIEFALIQKNPFQRIDIEKKTLSLLQRQVQNWNEVQKNRRNQKLELRRIKY